jgi:5-methylcytosine-specific restriction endonuclease McrA
MNNWIVWLLQFVLPRRFWYRKFYLRSNRWRNVRKIALFAHNACEKCHKIDISLDVHHTRYYINGASILWRERLTDLQVLCRACHNKEHERK